MGWRSIARNWEIRYEGHENPELGGRPVAQGEEGNLLWIEQNDFGHRVGIDLTKGIIYIDYDNEVNIQNGTLEISNPKTRLFTCDDTNILHEYKHNNPVFDLARDEAGRKIHDENGKLVTTRTDVLSDITFRPIWFTRFTNGIPTKVIGVQTTTPDEMGGKNVKFIVSIYADGNLGISGER